MDNFSFSFESPLSLKDYNHSYIFIITHKLSFYVLLFILFLGISFIAFLYKPLNLFGYVPFLASFLLCFFFLYFYPLGRIKNQYKKQKGIHTTYKWNINDTFFEIRTDKASEKYSWTEFKKVYIGKHMYFFKLKLLKNQYKILPKHLFAEEQLSKFNEMLNSIFKKSETIH